MGLQEEYHALQQEVDSLRSQLPESSAFLDPKGSKRAKELSRQRVERSLLQEELEASSPIALHAGIRSLETEVEIQKSAITRLKTESQALSEQLTLLNERISNLPDPELPAQIAAREAEIADLLSTIAQLEDDQKRLKAERSELKTGSTARATLVEELAAAQERFDAAKRELDEMSQNGDNDAEEDRDARACEEEFENARAGEEEEEKEEEEYEYQDEVELVDCVTHVVPMDEAIGD
jgi:chromosome segregation ATPase